jgi:hypothetical protein
MANHGIDELATLHAEAVRHVQRVADEPSLLRACIQHAGLAEALYPSSAQ